MCYTLRERKHNHMKTILHNLFSFVFFLTISIQANGQFAEENLTPNTSINEGLAMAHTSDGRIFIAERAGIVKVYENGVVSQVFTVSTTTDTEQGLLGITLHPNFDLNGYVYVFYTRADAYHHIIERVELDDEMNVVSNTEILTLDPIQGGFHNGGDLKFFNGNLFITTGDSQTSSNSQDLDNTRGKILRVTENGQPAPGNPFYGSGSNQRQMIWCYGMRNAFRLVVNEKENKLFALDVGTSWEEINDVTDPSPLYNYGWGHPQGGDGPQSETELFINPIFSFQTGSLGNALTNAVLYNPDVSQYPAILTNKMIFKDFLRTEMRSFDWTETDPASSVFYDANTFLALGMSIGIDGYIYYFHYNGNGNLMRLIYQSEDAPEIVNHPTNSTVYETESVTFSVDVTGSDPLSYQWQFNGVSIPGATSATITLEDVEMSDAGDYRVIVSNTVGADTSNAAQLTVEVFNNAPEVTISLPVTSLTWNADDVIDFSGSASDVEDGTLPASSFEWSIDLYHEDTQGAGHSHPGGTFSDVTNGSFIAANQGEKSPNIWYRITLTVTDNTGRTGTDFVDVYPNLINVTAATVPTGLDIELNQKSATSPTTQQVVANASLQVLNAPQTQVIGTMQYDFDFWEHGGNANQLFTAGLVDITYIAHYTVTDLGQQPYEGVAQVIPGIVEAEKYDVGGEGEAYHDLSSGNAGNQFRTDDVDIEGANGGGYNVAYVDGGEWLEYTVDVAESTDYDVIFWTSSPYDNGSVNLEQDGITLSGSVATPNTGGWQNWTSTEVLNVPLAAGEQIIRLNFETNSVNTNYIEFKKSVVTPVNEIVEEEIQVYPNPSSGVFVLNESGHWYVTDVFGILQTEGDQRQVDLHTSANGIYLLHIKGKTVRLIKN